MLNGLGGFIIATAVLPFFVQRFRIHFIHCQATHIINIYLFVEHTEEAVEWLKIEC